MSTDVLTVSQTSDTDVYPRATKQAWLVCFCAALFFFYEFVQLHMFNAINPQLMAEFNLTATQLSFLSSTFLWADILFLLPAGLILDRFSVRKVILGAMLVCLIGTLGFALSTNIWLLGFFHFFSGIGNAFCFLSCIMLVARWFPPQRQALVVGLVVTMAFLGGMVAQAPFAILSGIMGWRNALLIDTVLGVIFMSLIWVYVRDYPAEHADAHLKKMHDTKNVPFWHSLSGALRNCQNWLCGLYTSLLNLPILVLTAVWGAPYLAKVHGLTYTQATFVSSMIFLGSIIGCPLLGWYSDSLRKRKTPMIQGAIASLVIMVLILYIPNLSYLGLISLFFLLGFFTSAQIIVYPMIAESNPKSLTGVAIAAASFIIMGGGGVGQNLFGWLLDLTWDGTLQQQQPIYSAENYQFAMLIFPIAFVLGLLAILITKETYCRQTPQAENINGSC